MKLSVSAEKTSFGEVTWNGPEIRMRPYVQKSCNRVASTDIRFSMSPDAY